MQITELLKESVGNKIDLMDMLEDFLPLCMQELSLIDLPKITLVDKVDDEEQPTFGRYDHDNNEITLAITNRHPLDTLRTFAHELTHYKQGTEHKLGPHSGETGSDEENEAHEVAGIIMRKFNKAHPENFDNDMVEIPQSK